MTGRGRACPGSYSLSVPFASGGALGSSIEKMPAQRDGPTPADPTAHAQRRGLEDGRPGDPSASWRVDGSAYAMSDEFVATLPSEH